MVGVYRVGGTCERKGKQGVHEGAKGNKRVKGQGHVMSFHHAVAHGPRGLPTVSAFAVFDF